MGRIRRVYDALNEMTNEASDFFKKDGGMAHYSIQKIAYYAYVFDSGYWGSNKRGEDDPVTHWDAAKSFLALKICGNVAGVGRTSIVPESLVFKPTAVVPMIDSEDAEIIARGTRFPGCVHDFHIHSYGLLEQLGKVE